MRKTLLVGTAALGLAGCAKTPEAVSYFDWQDTNGEAYVSTSYEEGCPKALQDEIAEKFHCVFTPNSGLPDGEKNPVRDGYYELYGPDTPMD